MHSDCAPFADQSTLIILDTELQQGIKSSQPGHGQEDFRTGLADCQITSVRQRNPEHCKLYHM